MNNCEKQLWSKQLASLLDTKNSDISVDDNQAVGCLCLGDDDNFVVVDFACDIRLAFEAGEIWGGAVAVAPSLEICDVFNVSFDVVEQMGQVVADDKIAGFIKELVYSYQIDAPQVYDDYPTWRP